MGRDPKWKKFAELTAHCYKEAENGNTLNACWNDAFNALMDVIMQERAADSGFARELGDLEQLTDFKFNIVGVVLDYFDRLWQVGDYQTICTNGDRIISAFDWRVESSSAIRLRVVNALMKLGRRDAAVAYGMDEGGTGGRKCGDDQRSAFNGHGGRQLRIFIFDLRRE